MKNDAQTARRLFGELAVHRGYCTRKDVDRALKIQREQMEPDGKPKMLGLIMLEEAMIDNSQLIELVMELDKIVHDDVDA